MDPAIDQCLPEVLARDLELASDIFAAKSMTAGAPSYSVAAEYMARAKAAGQFTNRLTMALPYQPASARVQVLGSIEERDSMASFLENRDQQDHHQSYPDTSDMDSFSSADESAGVPPPPFRYHRNTSIITTATSFTDSVRKHSPQPSPPPAEPASFSWIDADSEDDSEIEDSDSLQEPLSPLSPRPPTPPKVVEIDSSSLTLEQPASAFRSRILHKKSHSVTGALTLNSPMSSATVLPLDLRSKHSKQSFTEEPPKMTERLRSLSPRKEWPQKAVPSSPRTQLPLSPPPVPQKHHQRILRISAENLKRQSRAQAAVSQPPPVTESPPMSEGYPSEGELEDESIYRTYTEASWRGQDADLSRQTPPPSPPRNYVSLAHTAQPYVPNFHGDELARVVPLPPDVIETLRVSAACFPETILLSSSLTIDTIRSYSKKMKHPEMDVMRLSPPPSPDHAGRKSLWRKVNPLKRSGSSSLRSHDRNSINGSTPGNIGSADSQKTWSAIQNVFGSCSEYICDALYAHIMAYNYVSAMLARSGGASASTANQLGHSKSRRAGGKSSSDQDDIPKKAATLLGLGDERALSPTGGADMGSLRSSRLTKRMSSATTNVPWSRDELLPSSPSPTNAGNEAPVRTVQEGLYKCIVRLISTGRLMSESGRLDEPVTDADATDADVLLMRSLCEIVRLVEETS